MQSQTEPPLGTLIQRSLEERALTRFSGAVEPAAEFLRLLARWNATHNLTAVRRVQDMVARHLLDAWSAADVLNGQRVADAGSGAGLPGIPLALVLPEFQFTLLERSTKKCAFLRQAVSRLQLANVAVVQVDLKHYRPDERFDTVVARALAPLPKLVSLTGHLLAADGELLAFKGAAVGRETEGVPEGFEIANMKKRICSDGYLVTVRRCSP